MYSMKCDSKKIDAIKAHNIAELKAAIRDSGACPAKFNDKQLQAVSLYVWDVKMNNLPTNMAI